MGFCLDFIQPITLELEFVVFFVDIYRYRGDEVDLDKILNTLLIL